MKCISFLVAVMFLLASCTTPPPNGTEQTQPAIAPVFTNTPQANKPTQADERRFSVC
jgi:hypothetical protein